MKIIIIIILFVSYNNCFSQEINYSVNNGSGSKNIDSLKIDYVIGEPIIINSILLADLIDTTSGIYQINNYQLKLFPNPTTNYITISLPITDNYDIDLLDNIGKFIGNIYSGFINCNEYNSFSIEDFNTTSGIYLLNIKSKEINMLLNFIICE